MQQHRLDLNLGTISPAAMIPRECNLAAADKSAMPPVQNPSCPEALQQILQEESKNCAKGLYCCYYNKMVEDSPIIF
jgi:hypothetical protein